MIFKNKEYSHKLQRKQCAYIQINILVPQVKKRKNKRQKGAVVG